MSPAHGFAIDTCSQHTAQRFRQFASIGVALGNLSWLGSTAGDPGSTHLAHRVALGCNQNWRLPIDALALSRKSWGAVRDQRAVRIQGADERLLVDVHHLLSFDVDGVGTADISLGGRSRTAGCG